MNDPLCLPRQPFHAARPCRKNLPCCALALQTLATTSNVAGAHCYPGRPCTRNLTCSTSDLKCYNFPRLDGQPCSNATQEACADGLACRPDTKRCAPIPTLGGVCFDGFACASNFTCVSGFQQCARKVRVAGEPCNPSATPGECGASMVCHPQFPYCLPAEVVSRRLALRKLFR